VTYHYYGIGNAGDITDDPPAVIYRYDEAGNRIDDPTGGADTALRLQNLLACLTQQRSKVQ
jgi:hypothetical protein